MLIVGIERSSNGALFVLMNRPFSAMAQSVDVPISAWRPPASPGDVVEQVDTPALVLELDGKLLLRERSFILEYETKLVFFSRHKYMFWCYFVLLAIMIGKL